MLIKNSAGDYDTTWISPTEIIIGERQRQIHLEDAVGSLISNMKELMKNFKDLEARHNSLVESISGSMDDSRRGSLADIDAALSDYLDDNVELVESEFFTYEGITGMTGCNSPPVHFNGGNATSTFSLECDSISYTGYTGC